MSVSKLNVKDLLDRTQLILTNAVNVEDIRTEMEKSGYDAKKIEVTAKLYQETKEVQEQNEQKDLEIKQLSEQYKMKMERLSEKFKLHRTALKKLYKSDTSNFKALGLDVKISIKTVDFINQSAQLYKAIENSPEVSERVKIIRIDEAVKKEMQALTNEVALLKSQLFQLKAEAQNLTQIRNEKVSQLKDKINEMILVAEMALQGKDQMLEAFGVVVK
ncbi:hypothetical protein [Flammeovirga pacifica]|uniref:Uncharacterized protein n=1 Tax=Flammeovirga pacifica TaxID=915059 RepID=A0A1S1YWB3_FLAPC|nr:hypothetical protein [Flammeovirga pacifica]OHX65105.1 hypothetical protein NH26_01425 [Flammeovirga pacifica]